MTSTGIDSVVRCDTLVPTRVDSCRLLQQGGTVPRTLTRTVIRCWSSDRMKLAAGTEGAEVERVEELRRESGGATSLSSLGSSQIPSRSRAGARCSINNQTTSHITNKIAKMSRQSMAPNRNLSLTEELEKLEQSITLTLQGKQTLRYPTNATDNSRN